MSGIAMSMRTDQINANVRGRLKGFPRNSRRLLLDCSHARRSLGLNRTGIAQVTKIGGAS
jgi:hypothetical protein